MLLWSHGCHSRTELWRCPTRPSWRRRGWITALPTAGGAGGLRATNRRSETHSRAAGGTSNEMTYNDLLPEEVALFPFQEETVSYALAKRRTFIADEMGLGKSISALTCLEAEEAYPAVIVCPASLRGNWERMIKEWLPHRSYHMPTGNPFNELEEDKEGIFKVRGVNIYIITYDALYAWVDFLNPESVVIDESHYCKNKHSRRTYAVRRLADKVNTQRGLVLLLTGTPVNNRPAELIPQLEILDQLINVAGSAYDFKRMWGKGENLRSLSEVLKFTCFIRHERTEVTDLRPTNRVPVSITVDNPAMDSYREVERNFVAWLRANKERYQVEAALRAHGIVRLTNLRNFAVKAKFDAIIEWIDNFLECNPERKLVVFAHHAETQRELYGHYGCVYIGAGQSTPSIEAAKREFMENPDERLIVLSLTSGREGHNLQVAHDVLFAELPWHPGAFDQAADRCNRIGQTEDVTAWALLAENTVDWRIWNLIEKKREMFDEIVGDTSIQMEILAQYADQP
jgi:SWI/SNF-related matrix-associated actin-dependent regulator of chromatin subfamily A-like protein 1